MTRGINTTILGAAAEHYVMSQLLRRGMIAALAPAGVPDADIIVSTRFGDALAAVQVKARRDVGSGGDRGWHLKAKHEQMARSLLFYAFVDFGRTLIEAPRCWVLPSAEVAEAIRENHATWLGTPGRRGKAHQPTEMRRLMPDFTHRGSVRRLGWMDPYFEGWQLIAAAADDETSPAP